MERYLDHFREEHIEILQSKVLFRGMNRDEIRSFIVHANPVYVELYEGQRIRLDREFSHMIGLVITGVTHIYSVGYDGTRTLLRSLGDGETSGLLCSMLDYQNSLVEFVASSDAEMIMFTPDSIRVQELGDVQVQHKILVNLIAGQKNLYYEMTQHLACLSKRTVRDKVMRFLYYRARSLRITSRSTERRSRGLSASSKKRELSTSTAAASGYSARGCLNIDMKNLGYGLQKEDL